MRATVRFVVVLLVFAVVPSLRALTPEIPHLINQAAEQQADERPAWVSAERALNPDGTLRGELFGSWINSARRIAQRNGESEECRFAVGPPTAEHFHSTASLADLSTNAHSIVSGKITTIQQGFYYGRPGLLLRLTAVYLKGAARRESTFLFYPLAKIKTAAGLVCTHPLGNYVAPAVGDRVLVFSMYEPVATEAGRILSVDTRRELIHESASSRVVLPAALASKETLPRSFDELGRRVVDLVRPTVRKQ